MYERLTPAGRRPSFGTLAATQLVSGVWHGLFPGYWLFFATSAVMFEAGKTLYRCIVQGGAGSLHGVPCACAHAQRPPAPTSAATAAAACRRYEQSWPPRVARFPPYVVLKVAFNAFVLNYAAAAFIVRGVVGWGHGLLASCLRGGRARLRVHHEDASRSAPTLPTPPRPCPLDPTPLQVLWLHDSLAIWRSVHFLGHTSILAIIFYGIVAPPRRQPRRDVHPEKATAATADLGGAVAVPGSAAAADGKKAQ